MGLSAVPVLQTRKQTQADKITYTACSAGMESELPGGPQLELLSRRELRRSQVGMGGRGKRGYQGDTGKRGGRPCRLCCWGALFSLPPTPPPPPPPPQPSSTGSIPALPSGQSLVSSPGQALPAHPASSLTMYLTHSQPQPHQTAPRSLQEQGFQASEQLSKLFPLPRIPPLISSW